MEEGIISNKKTSLRLHPDYRSGLRVMEGALASDVDSPILHSPGGELEELAQTVWVQVLVRFQVRRTGKPDRQNV